MQCLKIHSFIKVKWSGPTIWCVKTGLEYIQETQEDSDQEGSGTLYQRRLPVDVDQTGGRWMVEFKVSSRDTSFM